MKTIINNSIITQYYIDIKLSEWKKDLLILSDRNDWHNIINSKETNFDTLTETWITRFLRESKIKKQEINLFLDDNYFTF